MSNARRTHFAIAIGMASIWGFFFSGRLFPVSLAPDIDSPSLQLALYILFGVALTSSGALIAYLDHRYPSIARPPGTAYVFGMLAAASMFASASTHPPAAISLSIAAVNTCLVAAYMTVHLSYWARRFQRLEERSIVINMAGSVVLFCTVSIVISLVGVSDPRLLAALPLLSCTCIAIVQSVSKRKPDADDDQARKRSDGAESRANELSPSLLVRILIPCTIYFCLAKTMNVALDFISLQPMDPFRPVLFTLAAAGVGATAFVMTRDEASSARRIVHAFSVVSACLLVALFVTCCQTMGLLPLGNYALVVAKILIGFFLWLIVMLIAASSRSTIGPGALSSLYLILALWLPNFVHSALLALAPTSETPAELSGLFVIISMLTLFVSIASSAIIASFVTRPKPPQSRPELQSEACIPKEATDTTRLAYGAFQQRYDLSEREIEIVQLACSGKTAKRIARELFIAESTVYTHLKNIYRKVNVHSRQELVDLAESDAHSPNFAD